MNLREHLKNRSRQRARNIVDEIGNRETCLNCGENTYVEVHHIDGDKSNTDLSNLVSLCTSCHVNHHNSGLELNITDNVKKVEV